MNNILQSNKSITYPQKTFYHDNITINNNRFKDCIISSGTFRGLRDENQDKIKIENYNNKKICILGDGHGGSYLNFNTINKLIKKFYNGFDFSKKEKVEELFLHIDKKFYGDYFYKNNNREGTTITIIEISNNYVVGINLGDSNYIIGKEKSYIKGQIHKPNSNKEIMRILKNNNKIINVGNEFRIDGKLSLSRSIGDFSYKLVNNRYNGRDSCVSCIPSHKMYINDYKYILLASDGFINFVDTDKIDIYIQLHLHIAISKIVASLIKIAIDNDSHDNISIILIKKII